MLHSSKLEAQVPSGQDFFLDPHDWYIGHSLILALQELSKHLIGKCGGQTEIVEQSDTDFLQVPSGHL